MPPHCDSLDGPVVRAAQRALDAGDVAFVLPYVQKEGEKEIIDTFDKVVQVRRTNAIAREVADRYFFETVVRVHRAGEGASFTGLKPTGLDVRPIIPVAERAIESDNAASLGHRAKADTARTRGGHGEDRPGTPGTVVPPGRTRTREPSSSRVLLPSRATRRRGARGWRRARRAPDLPGLDRQHVLGRLVAPESVAATIAGVFDPGQARSRARCGLGSVRTRSAT